MWADYFFKDAKKWLSIRAGKYDKRKKYPEQEAYNLFINKLKEIFEVDTLEIISMCYEGTYEDCPARSYGDPNQGFGEYYWNSEDYTELYEKLEELYRDYKLKILENK